MPGFFAFTMAVSAALLFAVQPLVARMALPVLGGTPAVWNTCMVFFQAAVLAGYGLAHVLATRVCVRVQVGVFLVLIVCGAIGLPVAVSADAVGASTEPLRWLLGRLVGEVGLPAFALATASPLLQRWFAEAQPGSREPYFLYAASNVGSLGALLAYPVVVERWLPLVEQGRWWARGYVIWGLLVAGCAAVRLVRERVGVGRRAETAEGDAPAGVGGEEAVPAPRVGTWLVWIGLAAVPASLLQGCTLFLTTDVASIPLLWIVPLALYLLSFILAFSVRGAGAVRMANRGLPFLAGGLLFAILTRSTQPVLLLLGLHLGFLMAAGLVAHGRLVSLRPGPAHLTHFYLALSVGGVAGGAFNALLAPRLFQSVAEYPLAIALACLALPVRGEAARRETRGREYETARRWLAAVAWGVVVGVGVMGLGLVVPWWVGHASRLRDALVFGIPAIVCCTLLDRPVRLTAALAAAFLAGLWIQGQWAGNRYVERNFFGITRVTQDGEGQFRQLVHGNTIHGRQFLDPTRRGEPLTYYHREGPLGRIFPEFRRRPGPRRVGAIGLGVGSVASYAQPDEDWTFFEIDPAIIRVAQDPAWFTFLRDSQAKSLRVVEGDARLQLEREPDGGFDLLVLDAFSSDAIPVHLLTREALALYRRKLRPDGWLVAHISNRYLSLEPVWAALAKDAGMVCRSAEDTHEDPDRGKEASHWMLLARRDEDLGRLPIQSLWGPATGAEQVPTWSDQRASILEVFEWH